jgi:putative ABC transport system permease protein
MRPSGIRRLFRFPSRSRTDVRNDVQDEMAFHIESRGADLIAAGLDPKEARDRARREFGDMSRASAALVAAGTALERRRGTARLLAELAQDARYAWRLIARNKGFATAAVLTVGVSVGGNTAMFSVVNALFFQPLAIRAPHEIVRIYTGESTVSWPNIDDIRERNTVFSDVIAQGQSLVSLTAEPLPVRLSAALVSANYFSALGAAPLAGHTPRPDDPRADVVVLSERLWRTRFGGSESVIGTTVTLDGRPHEVIGVMPRGFRGVAPAGFSRDVWILLDPAGAHRGLATDRTAARFELFGRLKPGISPPHAAAAMQVLGLQMAADHPDTNQRFASMEVFAAAGIGLFRGVGKTLLPVFVFVGFLTVVSAFVLAVGCANLAGLLLGRAAARRQEIAVRLALGAGRGRLVRQLLTESAVLALIGGALGLALAYLVISTVAQMASGLPVPIDLNLTLDRHVLAYTLGLTLFCAMLFGLAPARRASRSQLAGALKVDAAGETSRQRFRQALIVGQVSVSALLLFWSGLFGQSLLRAGSVDPGFDPSGVLLAEVVLGDDRPGALARAESTFMDVYDRVRDFPGVDGVGWSSIVPLALSGNERFRVSKVDAPSDIPGTWVVASRLSPGWFGTVRIPLLAGRDFTWQDRAGAPLVFIVNETLAQQFWNGAAIGQQLRYGSTTAEVIGVVRDSKYWTLGETVSPTVYMPFRQSPALHPVTLHVRTSNPRETAERIRQTMQELTPGAPAELKPMREAVAIAVVPARVGAIVTGSFGLLGALLATLGVYGLISFIVIQRTREMAIRRAIGASSAHIVRVVVGSTAWLTAVGLMIGVAAGALTAPLFGGLLVNVSPRDPVTFAATALLVLATAVLASAPPALRAVKVDPMRVLKGD